MYRFLLYAVDCPALVLVQLTPFVEYWTTSNPVYLFVKVNEAFPPSDFVSFATIVYPPFKSCLICLMT